MEPTVSLDFLQNSAGGGVFQRLRAARMNPTALRPYIGNDGRSYITLNNAENKPQAFVTNTPATLTKDQWIQLDDVVMRTARPNLNVWSDLQAAGLTYNLPNGMGTTVLQHQTMTDAGFAALSMNGLQKTYRDRPTFDLVNLPLPIVHSEFSFDLRDLEVARMSGAPLDTTMAEQATRKCVELIERLTLGNLDTYTFGGGTIYGLRNYPDRLTKVLTLPTAASWTPQLFIDETLDMIQQLEDIYLGGQVGMYYSPGYTKYLNNDYSAAYPGVSLRRRLMETEGLAFARKAEYLTNYQVILFRLTSDTIRAVTGMPLTTMQWEEEGGLVMNFKIMGIMVPQIRSNSDGNVGIVHGTGA